MQSTATSVSEYLASLPEGRKEAFLQLRKTILDNLPKWFEECMSYGMIGYAIPFSLYPSGYHVDPSVPLWFLAIASQKHFIALYHLWLYSDPKLLHRFQTEYPKHSPARLDMGKSCIRFKKRNQIPYKLIGELVSKITPQQWITIYESNFKDKRKKKT